MNPLKIHDYLIASRAKLFDHVRPLTPAQYTQPFPFGLGTLAATLTHIAGCELWHMERMRGGPDWMPPPYDQWPIRDEDPPPFDLLEAMWREQSRQTRATIAAFLPRDQGGTGEHPGWGTRPGTPWMREFDYPSTQRDGTPIIITVSPSDIHTQLIIHEVHHRAQAMAMLRQLGIEAENLDPFYLMYKRRDA